MLTVRRVWVCAVCLPPKKRIMLHIITFLISVLVLVLTLRRRRRFLSFNHLSLVRLFVSPSFSLL